MSRFQFARKATQPQYEELSANLSEAEKRELEMQLLKPEVLPKSPVGEPTYDSPLDRYVKVYFETPEDLDKFCKFVRVNPSRERTTREGARIANALETVDALSGNLTE
jgi:hypothetical protein